MLFSDALHPRVINGSGLVFLETDFSIPLSTLYLLALTVARKAVLNFRSTTGSGGGGQVQQLELWQQVS